MNQTIDRVNQLILILFKQKFKPDDQMLSNLLKYFGVPVPRCHA